MAEMIDHLAREIACRQRERTPGEVFSLLGVRRGGEHLARRMATRLGELTGTTPRLGFIDISLYRDDWTRVGRRPRVGKTELDFPVEDHQVILVDDVLYTGRTVRAALDALTDFGRPRRIELAVLIDRGGRELPIQPDYVGATVAARPQEVVDVWFQETGEGRDEVVFRTR
ncbi:MAG: bifunctional pyr operon transcriptional regulator/uracil phosphoribosyltransferase PyrR [Deltaproteobacteria bacterium]|nr:bifunctional pyr operon transcriptional regulator/uracil phosphoribosyltransferase PyrR [Deltaproteobacteria bacterium]